MLIALPLAVLVLLAVPAAVAADLSRPEPRVAVVELIDPAKWLREPETQTALAVVDPQSGREKRFLRGPLGASQRVTASPFEAPAWAPDGSQIAFAGYDGKTKQPRIYLVGADGTGLRPVPRTENGRHPVLAADGRTLAFSRSRYRTRIAPGYLKDPLRFVLEHPNVDPIKTYSSTTAWVVDLWGGKPRRLTPWCDGLANTPTSISPDGTGLLVTKRDGSPGGPRIVRIGLADGSAQALVERGEEAAYSPDGSRIAFIGYLNRDVVRTEEEGSYLASELYVANADGGAVKRLSRSSGVLESAPSWDPSGLRLAYVQFRAPTDWLVAIASLYPLGNALMQVNADGTCREKILTRPAVGIYGTAWQPGPGRAAGPLNC